MTKCTCLFSFSPPLCNVQGVLVELVEEGPVMPTHSSRDGDLSSGGCVLVLRISLFVKLSETPKLHDFPIASSFGTRGI